MLLDPSDWALASRIDDVLPALSRDVADHAAAETHGVRARAVQRPASRPPRGAAEELAALRAGLAADLAPLGLRAAVAGTHPFAQWSDVEVSPGARYQSIYDSMRELARREPTFALHVHVAVPDPEAASARCAGCACTCRCCSRSRRTPRSGRAATPASRRRACPSSARSRASASRGRSTPTPEYVEAIDVLLRCDAFPEPTFLWWDVRLQPKLGTIEVRIMDAQTRAADNAALAALVQCDRAARGDSRATPTRRSPCRPEVLDENRFLATRDGMQAEFLDPERDGAPARGARSSSELLAALRAARRGARLRGRAGRGARARGRARRPPPAAAGRRRAGRRGRARARRPGLRARDRLHAPGCRRRPSPSGSGSTARAGLELVRVARVARGDTRVHIRSAVVLVLPDVASARG